MTYTTDKWIVIGSSPSIVNTFQTVIQNHLSTSFTITCNAGILLFEDWNIWPHHYLLMDRETVQLFKPHLEMMKAKQVNRITAKCQMPLLEAAGLDGVDELIDFEAKKTTTFARGRYTNIAMSGLFACQYAIMHGAKQVVMAGMDGYAGPPGYEPRPATFDGRLGLDGDNLTRLRIQPFIQSMVTACPDVTFVQYGEPVYEITGDNYVLAQEPASCR